MVKPSSKNLPGRVSIVEDDAPAWKIVTARIRCAEGFQFVSGFGSAEAGLAKLPDKGPAWC